MAKTPCTLPTNTHYGRFIGRVGGLAVALGIGVAIANNPGVASADDGQSTASEKSSATSESADSRIVDTRRQPGEIRCQTTAVARLSCQGENRFDAGERQKSLAVKRTA